MSEARNAVGNEQDAILKTLERWERRAIAAFGLLSLLGAMAALLLFEAGNIVHACKHLRDSSTVQVQVMPADSTGSGVTQSSSGSASAKLHSARH